MFVILCVSCGSVNKVMCFDRYSICCFLLPIFVYLVILCSFSSFCRFVCLDFWNCCSGLFVGWIGSFVDSIISSNVIMWMLAEL